MKVLNFASLIPIFLLVTKSSGQECPPSDLILPCTCWDQSDIRCETTGVTQTTLDNLFPTLRSFYNVSTDDWLVLDSFSLYNTLIEELDLTPLTRSQIDRVSIAQNDYLTTLRQPSESQWGLVEVEVLEIDYNSITEQGLGSSLLFFSPTPLHSLVLTENQLMGGQYPIDDAGGDVELFIGLSRFTNLYRLSLSYNNITRLSGGQFKRNSNLTHLYLTGNTLRELGENALLLLPQVIPRPVEALIDFSFNDLTEDSIHTNHGMDSWPKGTTVNLGFFNDFEALTERVWSNFLMANDRTNEIDGTLATFICDQRMAWLDIECQNDRGHTIFNTELDFNRSFFECPAMESIFPCICTQHNSQLHTIDCDGVNVTQISIDDLMTTFRSSNNVSETELFNLNHLTITHTPLTSFDLTSLANIHVQKLYIDNNLDLTTLQANLVESQIMVDSLYIRFNALTNEGLGDALKSFAPTLDYLNLADNKLEGGKFELGDGSGDVEFLSGLSQFKNLTTFSIAGNQVQNIGGGQFKRMAKISWLDLSQNQLKQMEEDALFIEETQNSPENRFIRLSANELEDQNINSNYGLSRWNKRTTIDFNYNRFESLSVENWEPLLAASNNSDIISFYSNQFICDDRMKWLKDGREDYEDRVRFVDCQNDPGHTIFTTNLV